MSRWPLWLGSQCSEPKPPYPQTAHHYTDGSLDHVRATKQALFRAMLEVPWIQGEGVPPEPNPEGRYVQLLEQAQGRFSMRNGREQGVSGSCGSDCVLSGGQFYLVGAAPALWRVQ